MKISVLSIIIPVYNEERTLEELLLRVSKVKLPQKIRKEIIVVNDGSTDDTVNVLSNLKFKIQNLKVYRHGQNKGKGAAVRTGFAKASGDVLLIQDADLEYNPEDYTKLLRPIIENQVEVVYGTRLMSYPLVLWGRNKTPMPIHWISNKILTGLTNLIYGSSLTDMETCYKLFLSSVLGKINLVSNRFDIEPEITAKILREGIKIYEVPIKVKPRSYKEGKKIGVKDGFEAIWTLIKYRFVR